MTTRYDDEKMELETHPRGLQRLARRALGSRIPGMPTADRRVRSCSAGNARTAFASLTRIVQAACIAALAGLVAMPAAAEWINESTLQEEHRFAVDAGAHPGNRFGGSVDVDGDVIVVGARIHTSTTTGGPNQSFMSIYRRNAAEWVPEYEDHSGIGGTDLGHAVAVSGDHVAFSGPEDDYVVVLRYDSGGGTWVLDDVLWEEVGSRFGSAIAMEGEWLVVHAPDHSTGRIRVYRRGSGGWSFFQTIRVEDSMCDSICDAFYGVGRDIAISGGRITASSISGGVGVWDFNGSSWQTTDAFALDSSYGGSVVDMNVDLDGDVVAVALSIVNAPDEAVVLRYDGQYWREEKVWGHSASDIAVEGDTVVMTREAAFQVKWPTVFRFDGGQWTDTSGMVTLEPEAEEGYGVFESVAMDGGVIVAGIPYSRKQYGADSGAAYVYAYSDCHDLVDNDKDGQVDGADPTCRDIYDVSEAEEFRLASFGASIDAGGWRVGDHPRFVEDITGDGKADIVGFGSRRVYTSLGEQFDVTHRGVDGFGKDAGFDLDRDLRTLADVDGDGLPDVVAFGQYETTVALANGDGSFSYAGVWDTDFTAATGGWRTDTYLRFVEDVTGDGRADIVAFGSKWVWVSPSTGSSFGPHFRAHPGFDSEDGWNLQQHVRTLADVSGDGMPDIVGFGSNSTYVALGNGDGTFGNANRWKDNFAYNHGFRVDRHPRYLADVNGDGRADIVGLSDSYVLVALSTGTGFGSTQIWSDEFTYQKGWRMDRHPRFVQDVNGDGMADLVGFGNEVVAVAFSRGDEFRHAKRWVQGFGESQGWDYTTEPRTLADIDGDGLPEIVGFRSDGVVVADDVLSLGVPLCGLGFEGALFLPLVSAMRRWRRARRSS